MTTKLEKHPVADLFPMMSASEFVRLKNDIATNGQRESVVVWRGLLVDGRNRLKACEELGLEPDIAELMDETDPVQYALSHNLHRRHLTTTQRSIVAAKLATLKHGDVNSQKNDSSNDLSQYEAAKLLNVSVPSLKRAKDVLRNGSSALVDAVESGEVPVSLAQRLLKTGCNEQDQKQLVTDGRKAIHEFVISQTPQKTKDTQPAVSSEVNAELTNEAVTENKQAIEVLLSAKNPLIVIDSALKTMSQSDLTALMLRCEELLETASA